MSRRLPSPPPTELALALETLRVKLSTAEQPYEPKTLAAGYEVSDWADHLSDILNACTAYAKAVVAHIKDVSPTTIDDDTDHIVDAVSDVVGNLRQGANRITALPLKRAV